MPAPTVCAFADGASNTSVRPGGYKIRPYGPASGLLVGAACMAARTESRFPPRRGRCGHLPLRGAFADGAPGALGHTHKKPEQAMQRLLRFGTGSGGRTHTVAHRNLNPARLSIPPYPLISLCILPHAAAGVNVGRFPVRNTGYGAFRPAFSPFPPH